MTMAHLIRDTCVNSGMHAHTYNSDLCLSFWLSIIIAIHLCMGSICPSINSSPCHTHLRWAIFGEFSFQSLMLFNKFREVDSRAGYHVYMDRLAWLSIMYSIALLDFFPTNHHFICCESMYKLSISGKLLTHIYLNEIMKIMFCCFKAQSMSHLFLGTLSPLRGLVVQILLSITDNCPSYQQKGNKDCGIQRRGIKTLERIL